MSKILVFDAAQQEYLKGKLGDKAVAFIAIAGVGQHEVMKATVAPLLDPGAWDIMIANCSRDAQQTGFPTGGTTAALGIEGLKSRLARLLSRTDKDGKVITKHPGLAHEYVDGTFSWPTVDAFGRPMPTLETLASMKKQDAGQHITSSGFAKCKLDGLLYYQQRNSGSDNAIGGDAIAAGAWRGYNLQQGAAARYWTPERHEAVARVSLMGDEPKEYNALKAAALAAASQPTPAVKPKATRTSKAPVTK